MKPEFAGLRAVLASLLLAALSIGVSTGKDRPDERLKNITSVFVAGNNQAAESARRTLQNGRTCLSLAGKSADADAVLEISADTQSQGGTFGSFGGRAWIASGTLTLKSGDLVWSRSERFSDAPLKGGGKTAGNLLVRHLAEAAGCKQRSR